MPYNSWNPPPPEVIRRYREIAGGDTYGWADRQWQKVLGEYPELRYSGTGPVPEALRQWYRSPADHARLVRQGYNPAPLGQHRVGLAVDVKPENPAEFIRTVQALGFTVIRYPTHVHVQAVKPGAWKAQIPQLQAAGLLPE